MGSQSQKSILNSFKPITAKSSKCFHIYNTAFLFYCLIVNFYCISKDDKIDSQAEKDDKIDSQAVIDDKIDSQAVIDENIGRKYVY